MAGKPPINDPNNVEAIQQKIDNYFAGEPEPGFSGLAYALGYSTRRSIWDLAQKDHPISTPIKRALLYIEADYEKCLRKQSCTGAIFALKNRGWTDKQEIEHSGHIEIIDDVK
jgi:hypothetical protein